MVVFLHGLGGRRHVLSFPNGAEVTGAALRQAVEEVVGVPVHEQRLVMGTRDLMDVDMVAPDATVQLKLRVVGGKGGFGANLRTGPRHLQKRQTLNFGACRTLDGRRMRHVEQERKLKAWFANGGEDIEEDKEPLNPKLRYAWRRRKQEEARLKKIEEAAREAQKVVTLTTAEVAQKSMETVSAVKDAVAAALQNPGKPAAPAPKRKRDTNWATYQALSDDSDEEMVDVAPAPKKARTDEKGKEAEAEDSDMAVMMDVEIAPLCGNGHPTVLTSDKTGSYAHGWECDMCGRRDDGERWSCKECDTDYCHDCVDAAAEEDVPMEEEEEEAPDAAADSTEMRKEEKKEKKEEEKKPHVRLDLSGVGSADALLKEHGVDVVTAELRALGMKAGGRPEERAARLLLTKGVADLSTLDKKLFAKKK